MPPQNSEEYGTIAIQRHQEGGNQKRRDPDGIKMSTELEPLVDNLLARMDTQDQKLESPEPVRSDIQREHIQRSPPAQSTPPLRPRPGTTQEEKLQLMAPKRKLPWRAGLEEGAGIETGGDSRRKQIRFGCLLASRGDVQTVPCNTCANGRGKFEICVALPGFFKGACASCQLSGRPNHCSIKEQDSTSAIASSPANAPPTLQTPTQVGQSFPPIQSFIPVSDGPKPKRRKKEKVKTQEGGLPEWERERPQWEQESKNSQSREHMKNIVQRPWATVKVNGASHELMQNGTNGVGTPQPIANPHPTLGRAHENQSYPKSAGSGYGNGVSSTSSYWTNLEQGRPGESAGDDGVALIDTLPKNKQRQIYGLISGLQGGIEHLQKELNLLKRAMGIDD